MKYDTFLYSACKCDDIKLCLSAALSDGVRPTKFLSKETKIPFYDPSLSLTLELKEPSTNNTLTVRQEESRSGLKHLIII